MRAKKELKSFTNPQPRMASPPMRWLKARKLLRSEIAIGELIAEEHADDRREGKGIEDP